MSETDANEVGRLNQGPVTHRPRRDWKREAIRWQGAAMYAIGAALIEGVLLVWFAVRLGVGR